MIAFARRNIRLFFRDRVSVFFSLLGVFIIIGLYVLFLGDIIVGDTDIPGYKYLMDSWIMAGVLAVTSITTTMGAFGVLVDDLTKKIRKDFVASPLSSSSLTAGYILSTYIVGVIMSLVALLFAEIYIVAGGGSWLAFPALLKVLGLILLSTLASSALVFFMVSFFKSQSAFGTASTILGTLIGFLAGIYIPIGSLPAAMQTVIKCFPISHAAVLFREVMMADAMAATFAGAPEETILAFKENLGVAFRFGDHAVTPLVSILILAATAAVFYLLALLNMSRKKKR